MRPDALPAWFDDPHRTPLVVGVLNATPDSFSDGGLHLRPDAAADRVRQMLDDGADWIDVGGESTRPGSEPVPPAEQVRRVLPAVRAGADAGVVVSIDTTSAAVAAAALDAGACVVNDVSAGTADATMPAVIRRAAGVVIMHMPGTPATMQQHAVYADVVRDVCAYLAARVEALCDAGVPRGRIVVDPGIGFGKTLRHNLRLLNATRTLAGLGQPLLVGASRKRFLGVLTRESVAANRLFGTAATVAWAVTHGASAVRVHDVRAMRQVVDVTLAMLRPDDVPDDDLL